MRSLANEAADEIERLRKANDLLRVKLDAIANIRDAWLEKGYGPEDFK